MFTNNLHKEQPENITVTQYGIENPPALYKGTPVTFDRTLIILTKQRSRA